MSCDVLLLTEVPRGLDLGSGALVASGPMGPAASKVWAAVWTRQPALSVRSPYAWGAASALDGVLLVSVVLPWRGVGKHWHGPEKTMAARTAATLGEIEPLLSEWEGTVVLGGDFNHALEGREYVGSIDGRRAISEMLGSLRLNAPTAALPHRAAGAWSIDHVAVPLEWGVRSAERVVAVDERGRLSDHDAYVVEAS